MKNIAIVKYLLSAVDRGYINKFAIKQINNYNIYIVIDTEDEENINTVYRMIEANLYVNSNLLGREIIQLENCMIVRTYNGIDYNIRVKSKRSSRKNKTRRIAHGR